MGDHSFRKCLLAIAALLLSLGQISAQRVFEVDILAETFGFDESTRKSVDLADLKQGCAARDCIPSIDAPKFVSANNAEHVDDKDVVVAISIGGDSRAYPTRILDHHEIVNDSIAGEPIAITWCPLCGSAVGIRREVGGNITKFGVAGVLYNSDLVFYDHATGTLWDQIEARGIVGPMTDEQLQFVPVSTTHWGRWRKAHPDSLVLSEDTGFEEDYSKDHYAEYRNSTGLFMPVSNSDDRIHPKTVVYGFNLGDGPVAFAASLLDDGSNYHYERNGEAWVLHAEKDGAVTLQKAGAASAHTPIRLFWFAWYTFHPQTELVYSGSGIEK
jgi:hypothetical protein